MEHNEIYTITIIRRLSQPLSLTIKRRSILLSLVIATIVFTLLFLAAFDYLLLNKRAEGLESELQETKVKLNYLTKTVKQMDQKRFGQGVNFDNMLKDRVLKQDDVNLTGLNLFQSRHEGLEDELTEGVQISVTKVEAKLRQDVIRLKISMDNRSNPAEDQGGYLNVTFSNQDEYPITYQLATGGELGSEGFPANFKSGRQYYIKSKKSARVRVDYKFKENSEYYTHVMILVYSYRGTLLTKHVEALNREIFLQ